MTLYLGKQQVAMTMNHVDESAVAQKVDKVTTPNIVYGTDSNGDQTIYDKNSFGQVDDVKVNGTSIVSNKVAAITLGTMASENTTSYYTKTEVDGKLNSAMHFKGTKARVSDLPSSGQEIGDMWNVQSTGANYAWDGENWDKLSENIDLSGLQPNLTSSNAGTGISITGSGENVVISNTQTSAEWGNITGTLSNQSDLQNALNAKANDSDVVKLTGNQNIAGVKALLNALYFKEGGTYSDTPASTQMYGRLHFQDSTGKGTGVIDNYTDTTGRTHIRLYAYLPTDTSKYSIIDLSVDKNGNWSTYAPSPATSSNSNQIATTAFVVNVLKAIYPVGAVYIGTTSTCPLASFFGTWTLKSTGIVTSVDSTVAVAGNGKALGLIGNKSDGTVQTVSLVMDSSGGLHSSTTAPESQTIENNPSPTYGSFGLKNNSGFGVATDSSKSGIVGTSSSTTLSVNIWERTA